MTRRYEKNSDFSNLNDASSNAHGGFKFCAWILTTISYAIFILAFPLAVLVCIRVINEYERAVIFRLGRVLKSGVEGPGLFFILPCIDSAHKVDLRTMTFAIKPQEVLTQDSVTITVDGVCYFRVADPELYVLSIENARWATILLAASTLRSILRKYDLNDILREKETISLVMQESLDEASKSWGVKIERVDIKDVRLPVNMQRAMATEAEATRKARAKAISAEGEKKAAVALRNAAVTISESPTALQLRYFQTLTNIAAEKNSTIIFPIPMELMSSFDGGGKLKAKF